MSKLSEGELKGEQRENKRGKIIHVQLIRRGKKGNKKGKRLVHVQLIRREKKGNIKGNKKRKKGKKSLA